MVTAVVLMTIMSTKESHFKDKITTFHASLIHTSRLRTKTYVSAIDDKTLWPGVNGGGAITRLPARYYEFGTHDNFRHHLDILCLCDVPKVSST